VGSSEILPGNGPTGDEADNGLIPNVKVQRDAGDAHEQVFQQNKLGNQTMHILHHRIVTLKNSVN